MVKEVNGIAGGIIGHKCFSHLAWIPGNSGICANETADQLAKQTAQDIVRG